MVAVGESYGIYTVVADAGSTVRRDKLWLCRCRCGTELTLRQYALLKPRIRCKHTGKEAHALYSVWEKMKERCSNPRRKNFSVYGGRGIEVCKEWKEDFWAFAQYVGERPSPGHSIDRIDNGKGYEPGNVRWATRSEQARNRRNNVHVEYQGRRVLLIDVPRHPGISYNLLVSRVKLGWSLQRATTWRPRHYRKSVTGLDKRPTG